MKRPLVLIILVHLLISSSGYSEDTLPKFTIYAPKDPPFHYLQDDKLQGASIDILYEILNRLNLSRNHAEVILTPWTRGFGIVQRDQNTILMTLAKTEQRKNLFHWIGPVSAMDGSIIALKTSRISQNNFNELDNFIFGVIQNDVGEGQIKTYGIGLNQLLHVRSLISAIHLLNRGRIDGWVWNKAGAFWHINNLGFDTTNYKTINISEPMPLYFAINKKSDPRIKVAFQKALNSMFSDGSLSDIIHRNNLISPFTLLQ